MGVKVTSTGKLPTSLWDAQATREAAEVLLDAVDARVFVRGLDASDRPLKPYSPATRAIHAAEGQSNRVDLQQTGALRAAVARSLVRVTAEAAIIEIPADQQQKAEALQQTRPFWGVAPSDELALAKALPAIFERAVARGSK